MDSENTVKVRVPVRDRKGNGLGYKVKTVSKELYRLQATERDQQGKPRLAAWEGVILHKEGAPDIHKTFQLSAEEMDLILRKRNGQLTLADEEDEDEGDEKEKKSKRGSRKPKENTGEGSQPTNSSTTENQS